MQFSLSNAFRNSQKPVTRELHSERQLKARHTPRQGGLCNTCAHRECVTEYMSAHCPGSIEAAPALREQATGAARLLQDDRPRRLQCKTLLQFLHSSDYALSRPTSPAVQPSRLTGSAHRQAREAHPAGGSAVAPRYPAGDARLHAAYAQLLLAHFVVLQSEGPGSWVLVLPCTANRGRRGGRASAACCPQGRSPPRLHTWHAALPSQPKLYPGRASLV